MVEECAQRHSGTLDVFDIRTILNQLHEDMFSTGDDPVSWDAVCKLVTEADMDHSGTISCDEFPAVIEGYLQLWVEKRKDEENSLLILMVAPALPILTFKWACKCLCCACCGLVCLGQGWSCPPVEGCGSPD